MSRGTPPPDRFCPGVGHIRVIDATSAVGGSLEVVAGGGAGGGAGGDGELRPVPSGAGGSAIHIIGPTYLEESKADTLVPLSYWGRLRVHRYGCPCWG